MRYSERELAEAIEALLGCVRDLHDDPDAAIDRLKEKHPVIDEIDEFGPRGPAGIGLGRFGGHAVGGDEPGGQCPPPTEGGDGVS